MITKIMKKDNEINQFYNFKPDEIQTDIEVFLYDNVFMFCNILC